MSEFKKNITDHGFIYEEIDVGDITFKSGQNEPIHRWYRLTPSYSPALVRYFIELFSVNKNSLVFDPFSGRGTTGIECQINGIPSISTEINPLLQEVDRRSLIWDKTNLKLIDKFIEEAQARVQKYKKHSPEDVGRLFKTNIPNIHDVYRWWQPDVLKELMLYRSFLKNKKYCSIENYLWLAINKASLDCANIHRNHPTISFDDNHNRKISVTKEISNNLRIIKKDVEGLSDLTISHSELAKSKLSNAVNIDKSLFLNKKIDYVITSPPYPNRFSYVHQTRPQLYFMELIKERSTATEIDLEAIGGTWGRATSVLQKELIIPPLEIQKFLSFYSELSKKSILMNNYATKYFIDMQNHITNLRKYISKDFRGAYVVGNSRLSGIEIYTEVILGKLFEHAGFSVEKIVTFRKRLGRKKLYETAILIKY
ncbi:site-specific DNA-methyltransferase [Gammaproteobacteria bacterium]|nr:site-specific DNA-methyltransferase [Gammaproteobacteria bacterium]